MNNGTDVLMKACVARELPAYGTDEERLARIIEWEIAEAPAVISATHAPSSDTAGASEGQAEPFGWISRQDVDTGCIGLVGKKIHDDDVPLYTHPSAELTALRERIAGMEKDAEKAVRAALNEWTIDDGTKDAFERCVAAVVAAIAKQDAKEPK